MFLINLAKMAVVLMMVAAGAVGIGWIACRSAARDSVVNTEQNGEKDGKIPGHGATKTDQDLIQGTWDVTMIEVDGETQKPNREERWIIGKNKIEWSNRRRPVELTYSLVPTQIPKSIDMEISAGVGTGGKFKGIYALEGDTLKVCYKISSPKRPQAFQTKKGDSTSVLLVMKRKKVPDGPNEGAAKLDGAIANFGRAEKNTVHDGVQTEAAADVSRARIDGVVVDEAGKPVAGAVVTTLGRKLAPLTRTTADGSFRLVLDEASARYHTVTASVDDGARQGTGSFQDTVLSQAVKLRIVVKPARKMTVRVTDAGKKPVDGAAVGVMSDSLSILTQAQTDDRGVASLRFPADARVLQVIALKPGVGFDYFENYRAWPGSIIGEPPPQVALTLDGARSIAVRAVDSADKPVPGIGLVPWTMKKKGRLAAVNLSGAAALKYVSVRTNGDGLAAFDWVPAGWQDGIIILQRSEAYSLPDSPHLQPSEPEKTLVARLLRNVLIGGKATLPDGKPAAGVLLQVEGRGKTNHYFRSVVRTRADGSYTLLVYPNQSYLIAVTDEQWAAPSHTGIVTQEGEPRKNLDFRLGKGSIIRGKVTVGAKNKPAAKQTITLIEQGSEITAELGGRREELVRWTETDKDGRYTIRVGPGRYRLSGPGRPDGEEITLKADEAMDRDFHLDRLDRAVLKGVVLANAFNGKPVVGAIILGQISQISRYVLGDAIADDQGQFEIERWRDQTCIYVRNPEGTLATILPIREDDDEVKIVIAPAGKLRGRLIDKAGKPVVGVRISCGLHIGPEDKPHARANLYTQTDDAGRFAFPGIVTGARCTVYASKGEASQTLRILPQTVAESLDLGDLAFDPR